ncbi:gastrula zinc finger protein XlCGF46.1-like isoform X2 [Anoplophora glabripennis]|uniref:gastrula zinc finger protein XlCGF46.1-like isoform X2 n=1 Tax=Anoplophora glabripennis TaxID=217634 RepID=UPI000C7616E0|nr:gastrula zinc finger protein XlCGF46.1-like isoform X2 [Anoplophora glabripennis]
MLMKIFQVILENDLPTAVCIPCFRTIRIAYNFIRQFKESNRRLLENRHKHVKNEDSKKNDSLCEIEYNEEVQDYNSDNIEEIIIEYKDFDNDVNDRTNVRIIEEDVEEGEEIQIFNEDLSVEEGSCIKYSGDFENNALESNVSEGESADILVNEELQNKLSEDLVESSFCLQKKDTQNFVCPICGQSFLKFEVGFVKHLLTHEDIKLKCNKCSLGSILTVDLYVQHFRKAHRFQCDICSKSYGRRSGLYYHMKTHNDRKIFKCSYKNCTKSFLTAWCLRKHLHTHSESPKYICSKCGSEFKTYGTYKYHQKTHDGKRNYLCTECGQTFLQSIHLKYHMWKHTGIKMFQCEKCCKSYTSQTQLKKHKKKKICEIVPVIMKKNSKC